MDNFTQEIMELYDEVPYPDLSYSQSHPDRIATMAVLRGMEPPAVEQCRVLELGCASGGNLIPMACNLPGSQFVGIDLSGEEIRRGQVAADELGLTNIKLQRMDILDVDDSLGDFDYIIAHGVYSWVPPEVREKIFDLCKRRLSPNGLAYISYNTYPGWYQMSVIRKLMQYSTRSLEDPRGRVSEARRVIGFFAAGLAEQGESFGPFVRMYADQLERDGKEDSAILHDELSLFNEPVYFHEFVERAQAHGLQFVADSELPGIIPPSMPRETAHELLRLSAGSLIDLEQYMDFFKHRTFRRTLLCHDGVQLLSQLRPETVTKLYAASHARPTSANPDLLSKSPEKFQSGESSSVTTDHPVSKLAFGCLAEVWPQTVRFDVLLKEARARWSAGASEGGLPDSAERPEVDAQMLAINLLKGFAYSDGLVEFTTRPLPLVRLPAGRPLASRIARAQAAAGRGMTNLRQERVRVDDFTQHLVPLLDGSHDRAALVEKMIAGPIAAGTIKFERRGEALTDPEQVREVVGRIVDERLEWLAAASVMIG